MIAVMKSSRIAGLTSINIMPAWCHAEMWREQYPEGTVMQAGMDIAFLKNNYQPNPKLRYCPKIAAPAEAGRKKNLKRYKSPLEQGKKRKKKSAETSEMKLTEIEELELGADMNMGE